MGDTGLTRSITALRSARRYLGRDRRVLLECHTIGATGKRCDLQDQEGRAGVAELDRIIGRLDEAIVYFAGRGR